MLSSSSNGSSSSGSTGEPQGELLKAAVPVSTKRLMKVENLISVLLVRYSFFCVLRFAGASQLHNGAYDCYWSVEDGAVCAFDATRGR